MPVCNPYTRETPKPPKFHESHRKPSLPPSTLRLTSEKVGVVRESREEYARRGGFVRIFPSHDSWELYRLATVYMFEAFETGRTRTRDLVPGHLLAFYCMGDFLECKIFPLPLY